MHSSRIGALIREGRTLLERHGVPNALHNAEWMLSELIGCTRADLYLRSDSGIEGALVERYQALLMRRCRREPLQYILGSVEFMSFRFAVSHGVFIPRFETELLVERAERHLRESGAHENGTILDLCSGSGVIALSLLLRNSGLRAAFGVDSNPDAVAVATKNAAAHGLENRAIFTTGEAALFLERSRDRYDLIVSNPPYIAEPDMSALAPEVREFEPKDSLCGGPDGLDFYRRVIPLLPPCLAGRGIAAMEIGAGQGEAVSALMLDAGMMDPRVYRDYADFERVVVSFAPR